MTDKNQSLDSKISQYVTGYSWVIIFLTLATIIFSSIGIIYFKFDNNYQAFFSQENPQLQAFEALHKTYEKSDNILFLIKENKSDIFSRENLSAIIELTNAAWKLPFSSNVSSISNFQHTVGKNEELIINDLIKKPETLTNAEIKSIKEIALSEPSLKNFLISPLGDVAAINVVVQLPNKTFKESIELAAMARKLAKDIEIKFPNTQVYLTGIVMMNNAFFEIAKNDSVLLVPIMFGIILIVAFVCLGSITTVLGVSLLIVLSISSAVGIFSWFGGVLTPMSAAAPIIILTVAVADSIHFLVTMLNNLRLGHIKIKAIHLSLKANLKPILLTNLTTMIGFLTMNFSDAPPIRALGNISALGVFFACILTISFLPALMNILPIKVICSNKRNTSFMIRLAFFVIRHRKILLLTNTIIAVFFACFIFKNELNDNFVKYFDNKVDVRQSTDILSTYMGGAANIEISVNSDGEGGINEPYFLNNIDKFSKWLRLQPEIVNVNTITDTFKNLNQNMHNDDPAWYKLPDNRNLAAQYLLTYEISLPYGLNINQQINFDKSAVRLMVTHSKNDSNEMLALESRINYWMHQNMPHSEYTMSSAPLMFAHISHRNANSMISGVVIELTLISLILMVAFKSFRLGLISLIPNLIPIAIAFGIWGLINGQVSLGISIVASITFGIVVDDTIHFMSKYSYGRKALGLNSHDSICYSYSQVGLSLWITTIILVSGFMVLSFSHFTINASMGFLCAITISIALFMDLLFLPTLLIALDNK